MAYLLITSCNRSATNFQKNGTYGTAHACLARIETITGGPAGLMMPLFRDSAPSKSSHVGFYGEREAVGRR